MNGIDFEIHTPLFSVYRVHGTRTSSDVSIEKRRRG
jgi:hypothetical protein